MWVRDREWYSVGVCVRERETESGTVWVRDSGTVCVGVCVRERDRQRVVQCERDREWYSVCVRVV